MENASKALIMAAEVLIGVIVISIGVALFTIFSGYSSNAAKNLEQSKLAEFNNIFMKYDGQEVTAHDIVTIAGMALQNNKKYDNFVDENGNLKTDEAKDQSNYYIQVIIKNEHGNVTNFEADVANEKKKNDFLLAYLNRWTNKI